MKLSEIATRVGGSIPPESADIEIKGVASLRDALPGDLSFLANPKYAGQLPTTRASAVLVARDAEPPSCTAVLVRVDSPDKAFAQIAPLFTPPPVVHPPGIHPTAVIGRDVTMGSDLHIGAYAVVGDGVTLGDRVVLGAHVVVGEGCIIGDDTQLYPLSSVRERCRIGKRVILHNGAVIGSDGYGYTTQVGSDGAISVEKIPQMGIVELGDDVEIGANTTIDRARFGVTKIGRMTKIDNLVQIGHNVQIGDCCGIVSQVGIAGSTHIGNGVMIWGQAGLAGHLNIGDRVEILAQAGVHRDLAANGTYLGAPAITRREALRQLLIPKTVETLKKEVADLKARLAELEKDKDA
ncbi:MAG: UDP-3-O-(3-hydroxymyristoyl)glucosamine N-acyltransferase [Kiritimatiellia bacterium]|jgi:UDP-3-O-[3-hydroxymyristoyl] glucosamine N-acyltransferase